jgi:Lrp/AsnC family leucine-responsive transcriptional regulator
MTQYRDLLSNILNQIPVPSQSHSYVVMEEVKDSTYITV